VTAVSPTGARLLVVDDNAMNLKLTEYVLRGQGYDVQTAIDAETALAAIAMRRPQLILMDLQLPGIDGFELTRRLKADEKTAGIIIVAVSAYAMKGDDQRAVSAGCDGYIAKPLDTRGLPAAIDRYLTEGK
jgi:CheY-like chemotaxis protein